MNLIEVRNKLKKRKPEFKRSDSNLKSFKKKWRHPRGKANKIRLKKRGHMKQPSIGYGSPKAVYGYSRTGLRQILITNISELSKIKKGDGILISRTVGLKKKIDILKKAKELGLVTLNIKDIDNFLKLAVEKKLENKKISTEKEEKKKKAKEELLKKVEEKKETSAEQKTEEEKKSEEEKLERQLLKEEMKK